MIGYEYRVGSNTYGIIFIKEKNEMKKFEGFIRKKGNLIVALVALVATVAVNGCTNQWYQAKEPEGLGEFGRKYGVKR